MGEPRLFAALLAGGLGTRLWPESRRDHPKQLLSIGSDRPLVIAARERLDSLVPGERILVIAREGLREALGNALPDLPSAALLIEPEGKGTAAAVALAARAVAAQDPDGVLAILPADHVIAPATAFRKILTEAAAAAASPPAPIVLLGIRPRRAATGFGYVQRGAPDPAQPGFFSVAAFHEKPDHQLAWRYLLDPGGEHLWNSGIFVARAQTFSSALERHAPDVAAPLAAIEDPALADRGTLAAAYAKIPSISFDHAVLERAGAGEILVRAIDAEELTWSDVGSWAALVEDAAALNAAGTRDEHGNSIAGEVIALDTSASVLRAEPGRVLAVLGLDDIAVVSTEDITLVVPLDRAGEIPRLRELLAGRQRDELL